MARPPVIAIMGHIDHGKSSLLDYIRKTNIVAKETGGITQHVSAYEVEHTTKEGKKGLVTFLDTPGHEAFQAIRARGVEVADIAVLVISGEDGVKPQTIEAKNHIIKSGIPYIVAITKIDKPESDVEKTKQSLAESEIYLEGYGGDIPWIAISSKTGEGIPALLDLIILVAELQELRADPTASADGIIIEADVDPKAGIAASLIIKNGTLRQGDFIVSGSTFAPVRIMQNFLGKSIKEATFSSPIRIIGFSKLPVAGDTFFCVPSKKEAEEKILAVKSGAGTRSIIHATEGKVSLPLVIKTDASGTLDAIRFEVKKIETEKVEVLIVAADVGAISENDVKHAMTYPGTRVLGFNVRVDAQARGAADRTGTIIETFEIIYKLIDRIKGLVAEITPKETVDELTGTAKILKIFSRSKDKQILGGRVQEGTLKLGSEVKILRRDAEIGRGRIRELQQMKRKAVEAAKDSEFGALIESKHEIVEGDKIQSFVAIAR